MKHLYFVAALLLLFSCQDTPEENDILVDEVVPTQEMRPEEKIVRYIESHLNIPATEKYAYKIYREELNGDDSLDYIVTVNLLERALNEATEKGNQAKRAELGYMGNFNYFFFMDGAKKDISVGIPVPSSPHAELRVTFENITTDAYKDIMVDFRIRNSCFRRFFSVSNAVPLQTFEQKIYDGLGTSEREAFVVKYGPGTYSLSKDIHVYKASLEDIDISDPLEIYTVDPLITETNVLDRSWFFNDNQRKYFTLRD